jgi:hypothetical protein
MCFGGGGGDTPEVPPTPAPTPIPQPGAVSPVSTEGQRANKIAQMKKGILSTIKTAPAGTTGAGSDLNQEIGKKTLGGS